MFKGYYYGLFSIYKEDEIASKERELGFGLDADALALRTQFIGVYINCDAIKGAYAFDISDEKVPELVGKATGKVQVFPPKQEALRKDIQKRKKVPILMAFAYRFRKCTQQLVFLGTPEWGMEFAGALKLGQIWALIEETSLTPIQLRYITDVLGIQAADKDNHPVRAWQPIDSWRLVFNNSAPFHPRDQDDPRGHSSRRSMRTRVLVDTSYSPNGPTSTRTD